MVQGWQPKVFGSVPKGVARGLPTIGLFSWPQIQPLRQIQGMWLGGCPQTLHTGDEQDNGEWDPKSGIGPT